MPTAASFAFSFAWAELLGAFNALIAMLNTPLAIGAAFTLAIGAGAFVLSGVKKPVQKSKRRKRLRKSVRLPKTRTPDFPETPDLVIPAALAVPAGITKQRPTSDDPVEQAILDRLAGDSAPAHVDAITRDLNLPAHQVSAAITMLELKGDIQNRGRMNYALTSPPAEDSLVTGT